MVDNLSIKSKKVRSSLKIAPRGILKLESLLKDKAQKIPRMKAKEDRSKVENFLDHLNVSIQKVTETSSIEIDDVSAAKSSKKKREELQYYP